MSEDDEGFVPIGKHRAKIEGDSIFFVTQGCFVLEELQLLIAHAARIKNEHGRLFVLFDSYQSAGIDSGARRFRPESDQISYVPDLQVVFGASFALRVVLTMMNRANQLLRRNATPARLFDSEKEAREFFEKERERLRREAKKPIVSPERS